MSGTTQRLARAVPSVLWYGHPGERAIVTNVGPVPVFVGDAQVAAGVGHRLLTGQSVDLASDTDTWVCTIGEDINRSPAISGPLLVPWESLVLTYMYAERVIVGGLQ